MVNDLVACVTLLVLDGLPALLNTCSRHVISTITVYRFLVRLIFFVLSDGHSITLKSKVRSEPICFQGRGDYTTINIVHEDAVPLFLVVEVDPEVRTGANELEKVKVTLVFNSVNSKQYGFLEVLVRFKYSEDSEDAVTNVADLTQWKLRITMVPLFVLLEGLLEVVHELLPMLDLQHELMNFSIIKTFKVIQELILHFLRFANIYVLYWRLGL